MILGAMQDWPLRVMRLVDHAEREHGDGEIVSAWADGSVTRTNWRDLIRDSRRMAQALERLGMKPGDRIATLAMNHSRHLAAWYGAIGMGGILHTINPRLFDEQLAYIANHAEDRVLVTTQSAIAKILKDDEDGFKQLRLSSAMIQRFLDATGEKL